jgi:hypothetical protein
MVRLTEEAQNGSPLADLEAEPIRSEASFGWDAQCPQQRGAEGLERHRAIVDAGTLFIRIAVNGPAVYATAF